MRYNNFRYFWFILAALLVGIGTSCSSSDDENDGGMEIEFKVVPDALVFGKGGGEQKISVQSAMQIKAESNQSWCKVTVGTMSPNLKVTPVTVVVDSNTEYNDRTAEITISAGTSNKVVKVTQSATDGILLDKTSYDVAAEGGSVVVTLKANGDFKVSIDKDWVSEAGSKAPMQEYTRTFSVASNVGAARTATITFTLNEVSEKLVINQAEGSLPDAGMEHSAKELSALMYPGWNLGNTLEAGNNANNDTNKGGLNAETAWQSTKTTQAVIDYVKAQGFNSVRIPCSWVMGHISDPNTSAIDEAWMGRVQEIVDYCIKAGLYVVLNDHWDGGWIEELGFSQTTSSYAKVDDATVTAKIDKLKKIWTQVATHFRDYDEHLLFAGLNEPFQNYGLFNNRHKELTPILNRYNQAFVDAVRATGGNNAKRTLVVQGPSTSISSAVDPDMAFKLPTDSESGRMMVEVHYYDPWDFCGQEDNATWFWGNGNHVNGSSHNATWGEESWIAEQFGKLKRTFVDKGYPVIIGEYGAQWRSLSANQKEHDASVKLWFYEVSRQAVNNGIVAFAWDINSTNQNGEKGTMTIINRTNLSIYCAPAMEGIKEGTSAGSWPR